MKSKYILHLTDFFWARKLEMKFNSPELTFEWENALRQSSSAHLLQFTRKVFSILLLFYIVLDWSHE